MHTAQIPNLNNYRNFAYHFPFVPDLTEKEIFFKKGVKYNNIDQPNTFSISLWLQSLLKNFSSLYHT